MHPLEFERQTRRAILNAGRLDKQSYARRYAAMKHDILGEVKLSDGHPFDAVTVVPYGSRDIKVGISRGD